MADRYLTAPEWLSEIAPSFGLPERVLAHHVDFLSLELALEQPADLMRSAGPGEALDLADEGALILEQMLRQPPLADREREVAFLSLRAFLRRNGADLPDRAGLGGRRRPVRSHQIADWVRRNSTPVADDQLPSPPPRNQLPTVAVCAPMAAVPTEELPRVQKLTAEVWCLIETWGKGRDPAWLAEAMSLSYEAFEERLAHEPDLLQRGIAPRTVFEVRRDSRETMRRADLVVFVGCGGGSLGAGIERMLASRRSPTLYLHPPGEPMSKWLLDSNQLDLVEIIELSPFADLQPLEAALARWKADVEACWRRRLVRRYRFAETSEYIRHHLARASTEERRRIFKLAGLPREDFRELLTPDGLALAASEERDRFLNLVGLPRSRFPGAVRGKFSARQREALAAVCERGGIGPREMTAIERDAERELVAVTARARSWTERDWEAYVRARRPAR